MGSSLSNQIAKMLMEMLDAEGTTEIKRNDFAQAMGCVPSQINYVISSRFTPEHGYIVESRRGGGGYIKITRIAFDFPSAILHTVNSIGDELDALTCRSLILNLVQSGVLSRDGAKLMLAATDESALKVVPFEYKDKARASIFKQMLLAYGKDD